MTHVPETLENVRQYAKQMLTATDTYIPRVNLHRRLGVEHAATFEEVQDARNYLYEVHDTTL